MAKKIIRNKEITKATRKFTDREQPRKVFWDKYDSMKQNLHELDDIYIITYYGVGGIGKSTLLRKLENELIEKEKKPYFVKYDFESAIDAKSVLTMIKTKLENEYKFDFPLFDIALYAYAKKIGENMERPEIKSLTEKSKVLSLIMDGVEEVPLIGLGAKLFRLADSGLAILKSNNKKYKEEIIKIENESAEETYKRLPYYFSQNLINNVQNLDKPLVIFLDTYEKLVNEVKAEGYSIMNDIWLRDDNGPILQVPGVLWVIAGREKIKWGEYDQDWEDTLDQHILGDLSFNDASSFLLEAGISDEKLRKDIYDLTNGTPVYLDICVSTYEILKENEEEITIDKFGKTPEVLVERFIRYMDHQSSEMVYMLSQIGTFNDEIIMAVASKILPNFSLVLYEKIKNLSFICTANNNYYIHKTVNNIFKEECPKIIKEKTTTTMYDYYYDFIINSSKLNENYSNAITGYFDTFFELINKDNSVKLIDDAYNVFYELENNCLYNEFILYAKKIYKQTDKFVEAKNKFIIEIIYGKSLYFEGKLLESAKILEKVLDYLMPFDDMDENNYTVYETMSAITIDTLSSIYNTYPNYQMISKIIKYMENHFADDDDVACYNLAILYGLIDDEQKSIKLQEKLFEQNDKNKLPICLTLLTKFTSFEEDNQKYLYYFNKLQELLENDNLEITIYNKINAYLFLADAYLNKFIYLDKALTYINKAEKIMKEEMYNSNSRLLYKITTLKLTILTKMENQENLKSYANRKYEELQNSLDLYNVDNVNTLTSLLRSLNDESRYNLYEEILTNFNDNLHVLYHLAVSNIDDKDIAQKCVDTILKEINNLSTDNIEIVKKTVFDIAPGIYDNEQVNDFIIKICSFYETKFENTLALIPIYEGFKYFYFSIRDIENCLIYTEKKKNLIEKHYGKNSFEYAKILYELAILQQQNKNEQETLKYAEEAKAIFEKFDEKQEAAKCEVLMALDITINNRFEGIKKLQELYTKYENNESIAGDILSSIAYYSADYDTNEDTIKICLENYNFFKEKYGINNKETLNALNTLGSAYHYLGDDEKALEMLLKAKEGFIKYCSKYNNNAKINLENIVEIYYQNANYNELLETAFILLERYNLLMESTEKKAMLLYKITYSYFNLKNYEETLKYGIIAYEMSHDNETATINNLYYIIISLIALNKDYQNYLSEFLKLYDNQNLYHLTLLNSIYINSNNLDKALDISINAYALAFKTYGKSEELVYYIKKVLDNSDDLEMFDICIQKEEELYQIYKDTEEAIALKHLVSKAFYLKKNGQIEEAISLSENVIKRFDELNVKNRDYIKCLNNLIILLAENDMLEKAKIYYDLALNLIDILEDNDSLKTALINKKRYFE